MGAGKTLFALTVCGVMIATAARAADGCKNCDGDTFNATFRIANKIKGKCYSE